MTGYLQRMGHKFSLFDVPLVYNFSQISRTENADLTKVFEGTLVKYEPVNAVVRASSYRSTDRASASSENNPPQLTKYNHANMCRRV